MPISFNKTNKKIEFQKHDEEKNDKQIWIGERYFPDEDLHGLKDREQVRILNLRMKLELEKYIYNETISQFDDARTDTLYSILDNYFCLFGFIQLIELLIDIHGAELDWVESIELDEYLLLKQYILTDCLEAVLTIRTSYGYK